MPTDKQKLGDFGENLVAKTCPCPKCKRTRTLKKLPPNFKCADLICDFCGYLAQVKTTRANDIDRLPVRVLGAAWGPQRERMDAAIYFPLYLVLSEKNGSGAAIYYLPSDLQSPDLFQPRKPLSENARRAGWQGFIYDISAIQSHFVRLV